MSKPRIRIINRHGFLAYRVISMPLNVFFNPVIWFEGKRYLSDGDSRVFFAPRSQPRLKPRTREHYKILLTSDKPNPYLTNGCSRNT